MLLALIIDQIIKVEVKTNMLLGEHNEITGWFQIAFVENNGMAFGMAFFKKIFLTLFRIVTVTVLMWYIMKLTRRTTKTGFIICLTLIAAGALGNIIDCVCYGEIFTESTHSQIAQLVPWGEGYGEVLQGKVVDMFYFPLIEWNMPGWSWLNDINNILPFIPRAYEHCVFFSPVFNFADACISCGVVALVLFYHHSLSLMMANGKKEEETVETETPAQEETR